jgi:hypothetical protein
MGPIQVSAPGVNLKGAVGKDITFSTRYPFAKLDSTNDTSFQLINLLFLHEPPNPDGVSSFYQRTLVYSFAHGYTYTPSTWFLVSIDGFTSVIGSEGVYITGGGSSPSLTSSVFIAEVDDTNVNFYIDKYYIVFLGITPPSVLGLTLTIRSYAFVNDLLGNDVPNQV